LLTTNVTTIATIRTNPAHFPMRRARARVGAGVGVGVGIVRGAATATAYRAPTLTQERLGSMHPRGRGTMAHPARAGNFEPLYEDHPRVGGGPCGFDLSGLAG